MSAAEPLVGRDPALAVLRAALDAAAGGWGRLVLLAGEAGIGKTAVAAERAREAAGRGAAVLWGQSWEGEGVPTLWPWAQVLRAGAGTGPEAAAELEAEVDDAEAAADLGRAERARAERDRLVDELARAAGLGGRPRRLGDDRERARKAVTARLRDAVGRIERAHPALGRHLREAITTGTACSYDPATPVDWEL
jgi:predicted ATPase